MTSVSVESLLHLKRKRLGVAVGPDGILYVADAESKPAKVYALAPEVFSKMVRSKRLASACWVLVIPRRDCLLKSVTLPALTNEEVRRMLPFEIPGLIPAQPTGVCYDVLSIEASEEGYHQVAVMLAPASHIEGASSVLCSAGVVPGVVVPSSLALLRWLQSQTLPGVQTDHLLLICVDARQQESILLSKGQLVAAREHSTRPPPKGDMPVASADVQRIVAGLHHDTTTAAAQQCVLAGCPLVAGQLAKEIEAQCGQPGAASIPTRILASDFQIASEGVPEVSEVTALAALGACLEHPLIDGREFNLALPEWTARRRRRQVWLDRLASVMLLALFLVALDLFLVARNHRLQVQRDDILRQIEPIRDVSAALEAKKQQVKTIQSQLMYRSLPLEILAELYSRIPDKIYLSQTTMDLNVEDPQVAIKGTAGSLDLAFGVPIVLEGCPLFRDIRPEGAQQVSRGKDSLIEYGCRCRIAPAFSGRVRPPASLRGPDSSARDNVVARGLGGQ